METRAKRILGYTLGFGVVLLFGCARDRFGADSAAWVAAPQPPPFLTTPAVFLLTNSPMFQAEVRFEGTQGAASGRLYGRGTKLLFAPQEVKRPRRYGPSGGFSFLWDAAEGKGYVLSEALQGYAPISHSSLGAATNVTMSGSETDSISLTASMKDGSQQKFQARMNPDQERFPITVTGDVPPFSATFEKVRFEAPPAEAFGLPQGFTAYTSAEAMVDEMAVRYRNLKRKVYEEVY